MEAIYYISLILLLLTVLGLPLLLIVLLVKPHLLNNRSFISKPFSRGKIVAVTFLIFFVSFVGFGGVMAATEPESVKNERIARELAEKKAKQEAEERAKKQAEEEARKPVIKTETNTEVIAFKTVTKKDATLPKGQKKTVTKGVDGERTITYDVTYQEGNEVKREEVMNKVTTKPVDEVVKVGTYVASASKPKPSVQSGVSSPKPQYKARPAPKPAPQSVYYKNCSAVRAAGAAPIYRGQPGYARHLDRDNDGIGCE